MQLLCCSTSVVFSMRKPSTVCARSNIVNCASYRKDNMTYENEDFRVDVAEFGLSGET